MTTKRLFSLLLLSSGAALLLLAALTSVTPVQAQCGSSASSCQTCHEINGEMPVNALGVWHTDHATGDYCAACHRGNTSASAPDAAHVDMILPLENADTVCQACHTDDYADLAADYLAAWEAAGGAEAAADAPADNPFADNPFAAAGSNPLDAGGGNPLDSSGGSNPLDAAGANPLNSSPTADTAPAPDDNSGDRVLVLMAEGLFALGLGLVWFFERRN